MVEGFFYPKQWVTSVVQLIVKAKIDQDKEAASFNNQAQVQNTQWKQ